MTYLGETPNKNDVETSVSAAHDEISPLSPASVWWLNLVPLALGVVVTGVFYGMLQAIDWAPANRYFLGHPVAIAATTLFCIAASILFVKAMQVGQEHRRLDTLRDDDLKPLDLSSDASLPGVEALSPGEVWRQQNDPGYRARLWRNDLKSLPTTTRKTQFVRRLDEVLMRQSHRTSVGELPEDLRELSIRDADEAHDSLGLVRIIVWAIPMLGFLGTVIGITQTLGGLDFTDGTAAVDRLKSGLYVAFDTTALGLVLSVVAIFLQFPVERSHQNLLSEVDLRVRHLVSSVLGGEDAKESHTALITQLCQGIQAAVAQSLATQAKLWHETIAEAQESWRTQNREGAQQFSEMVNTSFRQSITPALEQHAARLDQTIDRLDTASSQVESALRHQTDVWQQALEKTAVEVQTHRRTLLTHTEAMTALAAKQTAEDESLRRQIKAMAQQPVAASSSDQTATFEAMKTLAKAVDMLAQRMPAEAPSTGNARRAA